MKTFSRSGIITICAIITFVAGLGSGLALGSRKPDPIRTGSGSRVSSKSIPMPAPTIHVEPSAESDLKRVEPPPDLIGIAQNLWEMMTSKSPDGQSPTDRRSRLRQLCPEMAEFFIRKFRESTAAEERQIAFDMAIGCGGPKASALIEEIISEPTTGEINIDRINLTAFLLGNGLSRRPRELPLTGSLMARIPVLQASSSTYDRSLAVSILGYDEPSRANPALMNVLQTDPDPWVRQISILVLGRIGDEAILRYLADNREKLALELHALYKPAPSQGGGPVMTLSKYHFATALDDAIGELVERLRSK